MYKKPYYKKRKTSYRKKYYKNNNEFDSDKIFAIWILSLLFALFWIYKKFVEPNLWEIVFFLKIFIPFIIVSWWIIYYYIYKKNKKIEEENIKNTPDFLLKLEENIKLFKPLEKWTKEEHYQNWLIGFLSSKYNDIDIEETRNYVRPDIVINNTIIWDIAIEIKGPTNMQWLSTLPDKINKYLPKWDYLYVVLFDINIVNYKTIEENIEIYNQKKSEILSNISENKKDKVKFIEMWFRKENK